MLLKLFSINCQTTVDYRGIRSLYFHHLSDPHTANYIIPPSYADPPHWEKWVRHIWNFPFRWVCHLPSSLTVAFRATKIPTNLRVDVPVAIRAAKNLENTMLPVNYRSWQRSFLKLLKTCQQWQLTFLSTVAFWATKIPTTFRAEFPVAFRATLNLEGTMLPSTVRVDNYSCQSYKIFVKLRVDIPTWLQLKTINF